MKRAFIPLIDSLAIGWSADAARFGDAGPGGFYSFFRTQ